MDNSPPMTSGATIVPSEPLSENSPSILPPVPLKRRFPKKALVLILILGVLLAGGLFLVLSSSASSNAASHVSDAVADSAFATLIDTEESPDAPTLDKVAVPDFPNSGSIEFSGECEAPSLTHKNIKQKGFLKNPEEAATVGRYLTEQHEVELVGTYISQEKEFHSWLGTPCLEWPGKETCEIYYQEERPDDSGRLRGGYYSEDCLPEVHSLFNIPDGQDKMTYYRTNDCCRYGKNCSQELDFHDEDRCSITVVSPEPKVSCPFGAIEIQDGLPNVEEDSFVKISGYLHPTIRYRSVEDFMDNSFYMTDVTHEVLAPLPIGAEDAYEKCFHAIKEKEDSILDYCHHQDYDCSIDKLCHLKGYECVAVEGDKMDPWRDWIYGPFSVAYQRDANALVKFSVGRGELPDGMTVDTLYVGCTVDLVSGNVTFEKACHVNDYIDPPL
jgi:hypothetical protein